jgi:hypothetical protein
MCKNSPLGARLLHHYLLPTSCMLSQQNPLFFLFYTYFTIYKSFFLLLPQLSLSLSLSLSAIFYHKLTLTATDFSPLGKGVQNSFNGGRFKFSEENKIHWYVWMDHDEDLDGLCGTVVPWDPLLLGDPMRQSS